MKLEFARLYKQECPFCSGYGHTGHDCPTGVKLDYLAVGVREQVAFITEAKKQARKAVDSSKLEGFSVLTADPEKIRVGGYKLFRPRVKRFRT